MDIKVADLKNSIRMIREFKEMTQKDLSNKTGLSQAAVSYLEMASTSSTIDTVNRVVDALGYTLLFKLVPKKSKETKQKNTLENEQQTTNN